MAAAVVSAINGALHIFVNKGPHNLRTHHDAALGQVGKLAFFRISDNLGPKAHLARSDNYANKPRRRRENFGAFFKHFERFQWANQPKFSKGRLRRRFQRGPSAPAGPSYARAPSSFPRAYIG